MVRPPGGAPAPARRNRGVGLRTRGLGHLYRAKTAGRPLHLRHADHAPRDHGGMRGRGVCPISGSGKRARPASPPAGIPAQRQERCRAGAGRLGRRRLHLHQGLAGTGRNAGRTHRCSAVRRASGVGRSCGAAAPAVYLPQRRNPIGAQGRAWSTPTPCRRFLRPARRRGIVKVHGVFPSRCG
jgi:hypothetical protein